MRPELLEEAMEYISDKHIRESTVIKKHRPAGWISAVAAVLALILFLRWVPLPFSGSSSADTNELAAADAPAAETPAEEIADKENFSISGLYAVATASAPRVYSYPNRTDFGQSDGYQQAVDQWAAQRDTRHGVLEEALANLNTFFTESSAIFLSSPDGENKVFSPANSYIALAMLAEVTGGNSRQQILDVLNTEDLDSLRAQVSAVWESTYYEDEDGVSFLANSFWLDEETEYYQEALDNLAYHHYASSYRGDLGSAEMNQVLRAWLNEQTNGLLEESIGDLELNPESVVALASTVYMQAGWNSEFLESSNTQDTFHTPNGDVERTFMNKHEWDIHYYQGENYGAVCLGLMDGTGMWLFLPDEGTEVASLLESGDYMDTIAASSLEENPQRQNVKVNLSVPKFDVGSSGDLMEGLKELGITDVFSKDSADFTPSIESAYPVWVDSVKQAARVRIDEKGAEAASFVLIDAPAAGALEEDKQVIDFILNRPFLFVMEKSNIPIFAGVVNEP